MSLADRLRDLFGKRDESEEPEPEDERSDEENDEDDPSVYPLW